MSYQQHQQHHQQYHQQQQQYRQQQQQQQQPYGAPAPPQTYPTPQAYATPYYPHQQQQAQVQGQAMNTTPYQPYPVAANDASFAATSFARNTCAVSLVLLVATILATALPFWISATLYSLTINQGLWTSCITNNGCSSYSLKDVETWLHICRAAMVIACVLISIATITAYRVFRGQSANRRAPATLLLFAALAMITAFGSWENHFSDKTTSEYYGFAYYLQIFCWSLASVFSLFALVKERQFVAANASYAPLGGY